MLLHTFKCFNSGRRVLFCSLVGCRGHFPGARIYLLLPADSRAGSQPAGAGSPSSGCAVKCSCPCVRARVVGGVGVHQHLRVCLSGCRSSELPLLPPFFPCATKPAKGVTSPQPTCLLLKKGCVSHCSQPAVPGSGPGSLPPSCGDSRGRQKHR